MSKRMKPEYEVQIVQHGEWESVDWDRAVFHSYRDALTYIRESECRIDDEAVRILRWRPEVVREWGRP